jgi:hypothetical protein
MVTLPMCCKHCIPNPDKMEWHRYIPAIFRVASQRLSLFAWSGARMRIVAVVVVTLLLMFLAVAIPGVND